MVFWFRVPPRYNAGDFKGVAMLSIYVERSGGRWEARYWHSDEQRYFRHWSHNRETAVRNAIAETGYTAAECRVIEC